MQAALVRLASAFVALTLLSACSGTTGTGNVPPQRGSSSIQQPVGLNTLGMDSTLSAASGITVPALITSNIRGGALEYWPLSPTGGRMPTPFSKHLGLGFSAMAANGNTLAIASQGESALVLYNVATAAQTNVADPYGIPQDVAIDKGGNYYVLNFVNPQSNFTKYDASTLQATDMTCSLIGLAYSIAIDNEGDVFVDGYGPKFNIGVVEIPNGPGGLQPQNCLKLPLRAQPGYSGGITVDPKTDDLLVMDNPGLCAGGIEGRVTIYPKPYDKSNFRTIYSNANCAGTIRLSADSSTIFIGDQDVSGSFGFILQRRYPDGRAMGAYYGGGGSFTTIPNTLPN
ncbi:MAG: hypothetical protein NVS9B12_12670 [Vulcanimicrobiaceae bacterium]